MGHKVGKGGKHPVVCEVCPDRLPHGRTITVGQKVSGYPRMIHDRGSCRRKWERMKDELMARWPENRKAPEPAPALDVDVDAVIRATRPKLDALARRGVTGPALSTVPGPVPPRVQELLHQTVRVERTPESVRVTQSVFDASKVAWTGINSGKVTKVFMEGVSEPVVKLTPKGGELFEVPSAPVIAAGPEHHAAGEGTEMHATPTQSRTRVFRKPTPELVAFIRSYFASHGGFKSRTSGVEMYAVLCSSNRGLLRDAKGIELPRDAFLTVVRGIGNGEVAAPPPPPTGPDERDVRLAHLESEVARIARLANVQLQLTAAIQRLVHKGNLGALETLLNLVEDEDQKP
jgi:hypothetical protein